MTATNEIMLVVYGLIALFVGGGVWLFIKQIASERREQARMKNLEMSGRHLPASLHPVFDPEICMGSQACIAACPEGDVIGLVKGAGRLVHGAACVGHGRCAVECPVGAIKLVFGTSERGVDIPFLSPDFESNRNGVYIAGELGGMGLIKNALRQGIGAGRHAVSQLLKDGSKDRTDVVIVGAGPAGLGAALAVIEAGASYALIDQDGFGGTVAHYPRQKIVMTEPVDVPLFGQVHKAEMTKEELLAFWDQVVRETGLMVNSGVKLLDIEGDDNNFRVQTSQGVIAARKVVLAIGRRGSPLKLGVQGEGLANVAYRLIDPEQYKGTSVLVVGGGDSALEAAIALTHEGVEVSLSYRGNGFFRAKEKNQAAVAQLNREGKLKLLLESNLKQIGESETVLVVKGVGQTIKADFVIIAIGGQVPSELLTKLGIRMDRWFGELPPGKHLTARAKGSHLSTAFGRWFGPILFAASVAVIAVLANAGGEYYFLDDATRETSSYHAILRSSGLWGHGIGVVATLVMLTNFGYAARKRLGFMRRFGALRHWLTMHAFVGLFTPAYIAFHAAFRSKNVIATITFAALGAVVVTGIAGRYIYGRVNASGAHEGLKHFMRAWRIFHLLLALLMVVTIVVHIGVSLLFGYRWIF